MAVIRLLHCTCFSPASLVAATVERGAANRAILVEHAFGSRKTAATAAADTASCRPYATSTSYCAAAICAGAAAGVYREAKLELRCS